MSNLQPVWVREDVVRAIQRRQLELHGGAEGVSDENLLASALARPRNLQAYSDSPPDMATFAAAYAYGIAENHPFIDGNKRSAFVVSVTFLRLNGFDVVADDAEKYATFLKLAEGGLSEIELAAWFRARLHVIPTA